jgi:hypothetical protein
MMLEVSLPPGLSAGALQTLLEATRRDQGVRVTIRELDERRAVVRGRLRYPHPTLKRVARPLDDDMWRRLCGSPPDLLDTICAPFPAASGIAAPQIDELVRADRPSTFPSTRRRRRARTDELVLVASLRHAAAGARSPARAACPSRI